MESLRVFLKNVPLGGPLCNQTFLWGCAPQEILVSLGTALGQTFKDNPSDFPLFVQLQMVVALKARKTKHIWQPVRPVRPHNETGGGLWPEGEANA